MIVAAIIIFCLAALGGIVLLTYVLRSKPTPKGLSMIHGGAAFVGVVLLVIFAITSDAEYRHVPSILLFVIAAIGGGVLAWRDISGKSVPKWLAVVHGLVAATGLGILLYHVV